MNETRLTDAPAMTPKYHRPGIAWVALATLWLLVGTATATQAGSITGAVRDAGGNGVGGIQVVADLGNTTQWPIRATTAANGTYNLGGALLTGSYRVCFYGWNPAVQGTQYCDSVSAGRNLINNVAVTAGQITAGVNGLAVDTPPPAMVSLQPADNAAGVSTVQPIIARFDHSMDSNYCQVQLADWHGGPELSGQLTWSQTMLPNDTLTFVPAAPLRYSMGYDLVLSRCHDTNGNAVGGYEWSAHHFFSTAGAPGDTSAPQVIATLPAAGEVGGDTAHIRIFFDKPIDPATVNSVSVQLTGPGVPAYRLQPLGFELHIWPQGLQAQAQYQVALTTAVADAQGHHLAAPFSLSFNTGAGDTTAPMVLQTRPANLSPGLEWEPIGVFFSENMNPDTILPSTVQVFDETAGGTQVGIHIRKDWVAEDGARAKIGIDRAFAEGGRWQRDHTFRVELAASIADLAGNPLASAQVFRFTVVNAAPGSNSPPSMMDEGDTRAYRQADGRVTLDLVVLADSTTGGTLAVSAMDMTQFGKSWLNLVQNGGEYVYTTPVGVSEALNNGPHQLHITVTDPSNGQTRMLLWTIYVFDAVPVLTGGPADQATGVSLQPSFNFTTTGITGAAYYMLAIMDATSGDMVFQAPIAPNGETSYAVQVPLSQALAPNTAYRWVVAAFDSLGWPVGQALSVERGFTTGSGIDWALALPSRGGWRAILGH
ncbi:Ig-like domain-containing protein [uncultured Thiodictyon sp.]|uniref:Ig-like domain-containing protein n=1 Tax=uncultured Thiodictyon sp. TaxID=1846217 RepID=UPI0025CEFAFC|nr:Ig-like domain-containing protein [uncultured Thiodictyon sp.]